MEDLNQLIEELQQDLERLRPEALEAQEEAELLQREQDEIANAQHHNEVEMATLADRMAAEQAKLNDLDAQLQLLQKEYEMRQQHLKAVDDEVSQGHDQYQQNYSRQQALRELMRDMCDYDNRLRTLEEQKQSDVQTILDIHTSHQTAMQATLLSQEETKAAEAIEVLHAKVKEQQAKQETLRKALASAHDLHVFHLKREDGFMRTISQCSRGIHSVQAEEQEIGTEVKRLRTSHKMEALMEELKIEQTAITKLETELQNLDKEIGVERKFIVATRRLYREMLTTLWHSKAELHHELFKYQEKNGSLQGQIKIAKARKDNLQSDAETSKASQKPSRKRPEPLTAEQMEGLHQEIAKAEQKVQETSRAKDRAQDHVEMAESDLKQNPHTRALEQILRKAKARLEDAISEYSAAVEALDALKQKAISNAKLAEEPPAQPKEDTTNGLSDAQKQLTKYNTLLTDCNMRLQGLYHEVQQNIKEADSQRQNLEDRYKSLISRCTRHIQVAHQLAVKQSIAKSLAAHIELLTARIVSLEKQLADLGPLTKEHRRQQNETTAKMQKCRQQITNVEKERDRHLRDLMVCNYEVFLAEVETKNNWFKMKILTKDLVGVQEAWQVDQEAGKELWKEVAARRSTLAEYREELQKLETDIPAVRKAIAKASASLPTPLSTVCAKKLQIQEIQEQSEVLKPLLLDFALRHAEVEQELAELQERHNCGTVESALNSPSISNGGTSWRMS